MRTGLAHSAKECGPVTEEEALKPGSEHTLWILIGPGNSWMC